MNGPPLTAIAVCPANTMLVARSPSGLITGTLTLVMFPIPTGIRAWIEDVVVDESARGQGAGVALTLEALRLAQEAGARTVDLTSRPSREAAGRLYERVGFEVRSSRLYRFNLADAEAAAGSGSTPACPTAAPRAPRRPRAGGPRRTGRCSAPGQPGPRRLCP